MAAQIHQQAALCRGDKGDLIGEVEIRNSDLVDNLNIVSLDTVTHHYTVVSSTSGGKNRRCDVELSQIWHCL